MSEKKRTAGFDHDSELFKTHIGGSALVEGVMMRGKYNWALGVRNPEGDIVVEEYDLPKYSTGGSWKKWPIIRGFIAFIDSMVLSYKAIARSSEISFPEDEEVEEKDKSERTKKREAKRAAKNEKKGVTAAAKDEDSGMSQIIAVSMAIGLGVGVLLFAVAPAWITNLLVGDYVSEKALMWNVVDGVIRMVIFVGYIWLISLMPDMKRMFGYHGAEHVTIHCYEHGLELTPENARDFSTQHVRCGTAFLIMTMLIAILVFTIVPVGTWIDNAGVTSSALRLVLVILSRIILLPVVSGLAYEVSVRWAGSHPESTLVKIVLWPGMKMQMITTNKPDDTMIACAIAATEAVIAREVEIDGPQADPRYKLRMQKEA